MNPLARAFDQIHFEFPCSSGMAAGWSAWLKPADASAPPLVRQRRAASRIEE
jgi:hypothetical protein